MKDPGDRGGPGGPGSPGGPGGPGGQTRCLGDPKGTEGLGIL